MWCGPPPDASLLSPCCILVVAALAWAVSALGALACESGPDERPDYDAVLCIVTVASMLMLMAHAMPDVVALLLSGIMAIAMGVIATAMALQNYTPIRI